MLTWANFNFFRSFRDWWSFGHFLFFWNNNPQTGVQSCLLDYPFLVGEQSDCKGKNGYAAGHLATVQECGYACLGVTTIFKLARLGSPSSYIKDGNKRWCYCIDESSPDDSLCEVQHSTYSHWDLYRITNSKCFYGVSNNRPPNGKFSSNW